MRRWTLVVVLAVTLALIAGLAASSAGAADFHVAARWPKPTWLMGPVPNRIYGTVPPAAATGSGLGAAVAQDGTTYVCDTYNSRVLKYSPEGVLVGTWTGAGNPGGAFNKPQGIALTSDGLSVYIADTGNHRIQKYGSNGIYLTHWGKQGGPDFSGTGPGEFNKPEGVAVDQAGDVYVADTGNTRVQKFDSDGKTVKAVKGAPGTGPLLFYAPSGIAVAADGTIWVLDRDANNCLVQHLNAQCEWLGSFGGPASVYNEVGKFRQPGGIAIDAAGYLWITDNPIAGPRLQKFDAEGTNVLVLQGMKDWNDFYEPDPTKPGFMRLGGIAAFSSSGSIRILVADQDKAQLREFDDVGTTLGYRGGWGKGKGRFYDPGGVAVSTAGTVYVADTANHRLQSFGSDGTYQQRVPQIIPSYVYHLKGYFNLPEAVAVAEDGDVFAIESGNNRVQKLTADLGLGDPTAASVYMWGAKGTGDGYFTNAAAVAAQSTGPDSDRIYVADTGNNRIQVFDLTHGDAPSLTFSGKWPLSVTNPLLGPAGVAIARDGSVYVADTGHNRIVQFSSAGAVLRTWGAMGTGPGEFNAPHGLACDADGNVYVADTDNHRIQVFDNEGHYITAFGGEGSGEGQLYKPRGVAVKADGIVYVADSGNHRIQAFAPPATVSIGGVEEGAFYNYTVTPVVSFLGPNITSSSITLNSSPWTPVSLNGEGSYTLSASATDSYGASDSQTVHFAIDKTPPQTTSDAAASYDNTAAIHLNATDDRSGVQTTYWRLDGGTINAGSTATASAAGAHSLTFWSVDNAGNEEAHVSAPNIVDFTINDTIPPVTTSDAVTSYGASATIHLYATDGGSGVAHTYWRLDGGALQEGTAVTCGTLGTHTLEFWSVDGGALVEDPHNSVVFSVLRKPSATLSRTPSTVGYGGTATISGTLKTDTGAMLKGKSVVLYRSYDGKNWSPYRTLTSSTGTYSARVTLVQSTYFKLVFAGDATWAACSSSPARVTARAYLTSPVAPTSVVHGRAFSAYGYIKPRHASGTAVVKLYCYRYERGAWILRKTVSLYASDYSSYSKYSGKLALPYLGTWRMRAYHSDSRHAPTWSGYRSISVK